jgi:hypothetical protein
MENDQIVYSPEKKQDIQQAEKEYQMRDIKL